MASFVVDRDRERSRQVKIKQREGYLDCWPIWARVEMCDATRSTQRDFCRRQQIVYHFRFLRLAASTSTSKLTYRSFFIFWPIRSRPANQLFFVYGDASDSICQLPHVKKPLCRGRLLHRGRGCHIALDVAGRAWRF